MYRKPNWGRSFFFFSKNHQNDLIISYETSFYHIKHHIEKSRFPWALSSCFEWPGPEGSTGHLNWDGSRCFGGTKRNPLLNMTKTSESQKIDPEGFLLLPNLLVDSNDLVCCLISGCSKGCCLCANSGSLLVLFLEGTDGTSTAS